MTDETRLPGYDAVIPARVLYDRELPDKAKLLYGVVRNLAHKDGYCWAWDKTLAAYFGVSESCVSENLRRLEARRHILREVIRDEETKQVLERRIWIDRARFLGQDPDLPPSDIRGTPPSDSRGTPPSDICGEKINKKEAVEREAPPKAPPKGGRRKSKGPRETPDWKPDRFAGFWAFYPVKKAKQKAMDVWDRLQLTDEKIDYIARKLPLQIAEANAKELNMPHPATYLNQARWTDELDAISPDGRKGWAEDPEVMSSG